MSLTRFAVSVLLLACLQGCASHAAANPDAAPQSADNAPSVAADSAAPAHACAIGDTDARTALETLERLNMVTACEEPAPGVLRLALGTGWSRPPAEHHLDNLFNGYTKQLGSGQRAVIELWKGGSKVGEYTIDGLVYGGQSSKPQ